MNYKEFLWDCKLASEREISRIPPNSPIINQIRGMSTPKLRHCMNNLNRYGSNYLEVGSFCGSTFVSSLYGQNKKGWSIDSFAEFCTPEYRPGPDGTHKEELLRNVSENLTCPYEFFESDCFKFNLENIEKPVDVFMYDGDHDQDKHKKALEYFYPVLNDIFLFIVDDWNSQAVRDGTYAGMKEKDLCILAELPVMSKFGDQNGWWNGLYMAFLSKECPKDRFLQTSLSIGNNNYAHPIKDSKPRDVVLRLLQPENNKNREQIKNILSLNFPNLSDTEITEEINIGEDLFGQQKLRGIF